MNLSNVVYIFFITHLLPINSINLDFPSLAFTKESLSVKINKTIPVKTNRTEGILKDNNNPIIKNIHNSIPIVGIYTSPSIEFNFTKIDSNYIFWLSSGGAELVPISSQSSKSEIDSILNNINAVLIPNIDNLKNYEDPIASYLVNKIISTNVKSYLPLLALGSGANLLLSILENNNITNYIDIPNVSMANITTVIENNTFANSLLYGKESEILVNASLPIYVNEAVKIREFEKSKNISNLLRITAVIQNDYVSMYEGIGVPSYGILFNPEKIPWEKEINPKLTYNLDSILVSQKILNFFINHARRNNNLASKDFVKINFREKKPIMTRDGRYYYFLSNENENESNKIVKRINFLNPDDFKNKVLSDMIAINEKFSFQQVIKDSKPKLRNTFFPFIKP